MPKDQSLLNLFWNPATVTSVPGFALNLVLAALLAFLLGLVYVRFGQALSNRKLFARNFVLLAVTTTLVISIVKSSLALSLGLVGALSIVRFRAAIKEPEELAYLFLAISIGLGLGAGQALVTMVAFAIILGLICLRRVAGGSPDQPNLYLTVSSPAAQKLSVAQIQQALTQAGASATLKRLDETPDSFEASFVVGAAELNKLEQFNRQMRQLSEGVRISYLEDRGLGA
jgi:uncharacterized membrane protein YhiD involved in acid resistance